MFLRSKYETLLTICVLIHVTYLQNYISINFISVLYIAYIVVRFVM